MVLGWGGLRWGAPELARTSAIEEVGRVGTLSGRIWHHQPTLPWDTLSEIVLVGSGACLASSEQRALGIHNTYAGRVGNLFGISIRAASASEPEDAPLEITTHMLVGSGACLAEFGIIIRAPPSNEE